jgi:hypothetical protein
MKYILPLSVLVPIAFVLEFAHIGDRRLSSRHPPCR